MCGILCILGVKDNDVKKIKQEGMECIKLLRHRGPDWGNYKIIENDNNTNNILFHERLAIIDPKSGAQPITTDRCSISVNGEIYNHIELKEQYFKNKKFNTGSDCEIIAHLFDYYTSNNRDSIKSIPNILNGQFAFVAVKENDNRILIARDPLGIAPLYYGVDKSDNLWVSSELKAIHNKVKVPMEFPPGCCLTTNNINDIHRYYRPNWWGGELPNSWKFNKSHLELVKKDIEDKLTVSVKKRMMSDVPFGILLSGGLDSSIIASIAIKNVMNPGKIKTFSIGLHDSPDLIAAKKVAEYLGTDHHSITYSLEEGYYALNDVIYHLETYDITTIRAGTPMYLLGRVIKAMGIKMVLSGEGADEALGGYLYFHKSPSNESFFKETCKKLEDLHYYDVLRANKSLMAWGVEVRVPFLDKDFLDLVMNIDPEIKKPLPRHDNGKAIEKYILRKSFENEYLPDDILWRQKEQFSDGVGYSWIDNLKNMVNEEITDAQFSSFQEKTLYYPPQTKEGCYYRMLFQIHFPHSSCQELVPNNKTIACSSAIAANWDEKWKDISEASARIVKDVHESTL